jgi:hypothetical protein
LIPEFAVLAPPIEIGVAGAAGLQEGRNTGLSMAKTIES